MVTASAAHNFDWRDHLARDPNVMGGETVFRGTRVLLRTILASLADGDSPDLLLKEFPALKPDHVRAAIAFAAESAREDIPAVPPPAAA